MFRLTFLHRLRGFSAVVLAGFLAVIAAKAQVSPGATKDEVIRVLGWPKSTSTTDQRQILNYPDCTVMMKDGRVEKLVYKFPDGRLHLWNQLAQPKNTDPSNNQTKSAPPSANAQLPAQPVTQYPDPAPRVTYQAPTPIRYTQDRTADPWGTFTTVLTWVVVLILVALTIFKVALSDGKRWGKLQSDLLRKTPRQPLPPEPPIISTQPPRRKPDPLKDGWSLELLNEIEWHRFEQVVVAYEKALGHDARLTDFGPDGGIDAKVFDPASGKVKRLIQCKAYNQRLKVDFIRAFYGVMAHEGVESATFYTTDSFSRDCVEFAQGKNLELVDGATLVARIKQLDLPNQIRLFETATEGDYTTPTCPSCGTKMRLIPRKIGRDFWGCRNYPKCRAKLHVSRV